MVKLWFKNPDLQLAKVLGNSVKKKKKKKATVCNISLTPKIWFCS